MVYAKRPFGEPEQVIEYLGRYTQKIAISNHRLSTIDDDTVCFAYKDYRQAGNKKQMTLDAIEFIRRFSMHILPKSFVRIRHYAMLSNAVKHKVLPVLQKQLITVTKPAEYKAQTPPMPPKICPCCKKEIIKTELMNT